MSFGSSVAALLFTLLPNKPKRVLLAEPILDLPPFSDDAVKGMYNTTQSIPSEEDILKANPKWVPMEAVLRRMSLTQMDPKAITQLCEVSRLVIMHLAWRAGEARSARNERPCLGVGVNA